MLRVAAAAVLLSFAATASPQEHHAPAGSSGGPPASEPGVDWPRGPLALRLGLLLEPPEGAKDTVAVDGPARGPAAPSLCPVDWCQPRVEVPGLEAARGHISRPELVATLLDDAGAAPLASLVWLVARTGLEVEWTPPHLASALGGTSGGRGNLFLWFKLKIDAWDRPTLPTRERDRIRKEQELEEERERAREEERAREQANERPAHLGRT